MLLFLIIFFCFVASIGVYLFIKLFSKTHSKIAVGVVHGLLGLFGISLLIIYTSFLKGDTPYLSILFFVMAFFFGGGMFAMTIQGKTFPKFIAYIHIALALSGICLLISFGIQ